MKALRVIIVNLCRLLLGLTFIFSGFVKATDPLGTQYKIIDYFTVLHVVDFIPTWVSLALSIALSALEFTLGILVLLAMHRRSASKVTLAFMAFMTAVTLWLAVANPIKDCGCFGDAIHLTNWQTFFKNVVLLAAAIVITWHPLDMARFISRSNQWIAVNYTMLFILAYSFYTLYALPPFDFRPYHVGANLIKGMQIPKGAPLPKFKTTFILQKNGRQKEFTLDNYPDSTWQFVTSKTVQVSAGYVPPIHDFSIETLNSGEDSTQQILQHKGYTFMLISPDLSRADDSNFGDIDRVYEFARQYKYPFICLTASGNKDIAHWQDITGAEYTFYHTDETTLKTIIRSNPGLVLLHNGTVVAKWSHNQLPTDEQLSKPLEKSELGRPSPSTPAYRIWCIFMWYVLPIMLLVITDRLWAWTQWIRNKEKNNIIVSTFNNKHKKQ